MSGLKDFLTNLAVNLPGGQELTWDNYEDEVWKRVFPKQYEYATNEKDSPLHYCMAKKFNLQKRCQQHKLIPVQCDEQLPTSVPGAIEELTRLQGTFWTTAWADAQGPVVRESKSTLKDVKRELLKATIADKMNPTKEEEQELKDAIEEELQNLGMKAADDHGPTQMFLALMNRMDNLEEDLKKAPPDRMGQYMQCRELQQSYIDRLGAAMKAQAILEQGQVQIYEKLKKYKSDTEILWWDLTTKNDRTYSPQLDGPTLMEGFAYEGLVPDEIAGKGTMFRPPPKMSELVVPMVANLVPEQSGCQDDITDKQEEIAELTEEVSKCTTDDEKKKKKRELNCAKAQLKQLKAFNSNLQKQISSVHNSVDNSFQQAQQCQEMEKALNKALDDNREAFADFANGTTALKAVWRSKNPENEGASFETRICTETFSMQTSESTTTAQSTQVTAGVSGGGSFMGFTAKASASVAHGSQSAHTEGEDHAKQHVFHFECEGCYGRLINPLMDTVLQAFKSPEWFIEGEKPGSFWNPPTEERPEGRNIRFYVDQIFFARKLMFKTSDSEASNQISANTATTSNSASWSFEAGYAGVSGGTSGSVAHASTKSDQQSSMEKNSKDDALYHGNLYIKFLLLKPVIPAPKRASLEPKDLQWNAPSYASEHLGVQ